MSGKVNVRLDNTLARRKGALERLTKQISVYDYNLGKPEGLKEGVEDLFKKKIQRAKEEQKILEARTVPGYVKPSRSSNKVRREHITQVVGRFK